LQDDDTGCETQARRKLAVKDAGVACCTDLKEELQLLKIDCVEKRNMHIVIDSSILVPVFVGFLGVLIGVVVAGTWK
jgi:hypothetical protein